MVSNKVKRFITYAFLVALLILVLYFTVRPMFFVKEAITFVSGTEYISAEPGQTIVRLADSDGNPIVGYSCEATILYPDKTYFMLDQPMTESTVQGNYYRSFTTPETTGVYEETVTCTKEDRTLKVSSSFHVSLALKLVEQIYLNQTTQFDAIMSKFNDTQNRLNELSALINATSEDLNNRVNETQTRLNESISLKFARLYADIINSSQAKTDIFSKFFFG